MKRGNLEVLLVHAEGIKHTYRVVGTPAYYVIVQCGKEVHKSKVSSVKDERVGWNEKFKFEFPITDWKQLTHLKFRIMEKSFFTDGRFVGETIIYLGGIIAEGTNREILEVKAAPYNVVLEDDTFKGEIKIGLKFITNTETLTETRAFVVWENEPTQSKYRFPINPWKFSWWRSLFYFYRRNYESKEN